ncbi:MAG TPA: tagaturonate reductase [Longimicrobiaceae bacterium]|nr:tagaturonate reductase [Longimicrobiaceae bacterium]
MSALPTLGRSLASSPALQARRDLAVPAPELLELPEKAVQFGTGAFLRGFVDYFLDAANRAGRFGGRVVMVGSTGSGRDQAVNDQDGLYTLSEQGIADGAPRREHRVVGSVSRALSAPDEWPAVLACARNPELELVFSNTTEVGIALDEEDRPDLDPPRSFPGKLARFLYERARAFRFDPARGVVVLPCELIEDNGDRLREIVLALAERWGLGDEFARWIRDAVPFCNTLVDRIVPGAPTGAQREEIVAELGYEDALLTACEPYRLFVVQADERTRGRLGFAAADPGVVLTDDVAPFRERKVRLLNGAHSVTVAAALLAGCATVREAVEHETVGRLLRRALFEEIAPFVDAPGAGRFAREVLDRFANPYIHHALWDITLQATMKMRVRVVPSVLQYAARTGDTPGSLAFGFAAYLLFRRGDLQAARRQAGLPVPPDDQGERIRGLWSALPDASPAALRGLARAACADADSWGADLGAVPGFADAVAAALERMHREGVPAALEAHLQTVAAA